MHAIGIRPSVVLYGKLPDTVLAVDRLPHTRLFPRMATVCHHGGAGTVTAGFRVGIPSVIIPFALDQFAWAERSYEPGVGDCAMVRAKAMEPKASNFA